MFSSGLQASGFTCDALTVPGNSGASPGQCSVNAGAWGYPGTSGAGEADWIDVEVIPVPAASYRLMDGVAGRPGNGPATAGAGSGPFLLGTTFAALAAGCWLEGFWFWVCPSGGGTAAQKFALWNTSPATPVLIPAATVTSGTLASGWNYVPLASPVPLAVDTPYMAVTGVPGNNIPQSSSTGLGTGAVDSFGAGGHTNGIFNGPLMAWSDSPANDAACTNPVPAGAYTASQGVFAAGLGSDPTAAAPAGAGNSANYWVDVQITTQPPARTSYRMLPNHYGWGGAFVSGDASVNYVLGTEMHLTQRCTLGKIWYVSPNGTAQLATECAVWDLATQTKVAEATSPTWFKPDGSTGTAGSGWLYTTFPAGTYLQAGRYRVSIYNSAASPDAWSAKGLYVFNIGPGSAFAGSGGMAGFGSGKTFSWGPPWSGVRAGPLYVPGIANASRALWYVDTQMDLGGAGAATATFAVGPPNSFPDLHVKGLGQYYWVDMEVTPVTAGGLLLASFP